MRSHAALLAIGLALLLVTPTATPALQQTTAAPDEPGVAIDVRLSESGDARWTIATGFALNSSNETEAFRRLAEDYVEGRTDAGFSASDFRGVASSVSDRSGREMSITDTNRTWAIVGSGDNRTGVLALEFTWTNFARTGPDRVVVDDAFSGGWLDRLSDNQVFRVHGPGKYGVQTAVPPARLENGTATWTGPREFGSGQPRVVFTPGGGGDTTTPGDDQPSDVQMVLAVLAALLVGGLVAYVWTKREGDDGTGDGDAVAAADVPEPDNPGAATAGPNPAESEEAGPEPDDTGEPAVDPELLSDEERVERLLRRNGGRMKQADIVTETGWSNAKVSQLLSSMDDEDRVDKLRIGRENLITLADENFDEVG
jgi:hypothetical protein